MLKSRFARSHREGGQADRPKPPAKTKHAVPRQPRLFPPRPPPTLPTSPGKIQTTHLRLWEQRSRSAATLPFQTSSAFSSSLPQPAGNARTKHNHPATTANRTRRENTGTRAGNTEKSLFRAAKVDSSHNARHPHLYTSKWRSRSHGKQYRCRSSRRAEPTPTRLHFGSAPIRHERRAARTNLTSNKSASRRTSRLRTENFILF